MICHDVVEYFRCTDGIIERVLAFHPLATLAPGVLSLLVLNGFFRLTVSSVACRNRVGFLFSFIFGVPTPILCRYLVYSSRLYLQLGNLFLRTQLRLQPCRTLRGPRFGWARRDLQDSVDGIYDVRVFVTRV